MMRTIQITLLTLALAGALQGCVAPVIVGAGALMVADRRTTGAYIEDESIENKSLSQILAKYKNNAGVHVNVTSYNRHALITGEVPDEAVKADVAAIVSAQGNVRGTTNELTISGATSLTSRSNDTLLTSNVKARFLGNKVFSPNHVKVITENGTVFLMGLVCQPEANAAAEIASTSSGVQRVVKVFENIECPPPPAKH
ncbi:BON domain-containing protein [Ferriphaselus sp. R-1]|uniref:BON domain-containing protein n=1 Tax=Ferriphaselus sp. R-1 TaxID=1485544 RepID=UPI000A6121A8|nr:BON domain-containing protein [Ferriphaselus sp. R-1]